MATTPFPVSALGKVLWDNEGLQVLMATENPGLFPEGEFSLSPQ